MSGQISTLKVFLHEKPIATITHVGNDRTLFAFDESYINDENRATLSLSCKDQFGELITDFKPTQTKLIPFFSNLLPEETLRNYLAKLADINPAREFFLLWVLGQDLPGAIRIEPADGEDLPPVSQQETGDEQEISHAMRFSLAGVQLKFSAVQDTAGGLTIPASGEGGSWIVKLPSARFAGVPENEFSMMELARKLGMDVPKTQLLPIEQIHNIPAGIKSFGSTAFAIQRFDRSEFAAVHIEDFAQVFGVYPHEKYDKASMANIAQVLGAEAQEKDIREFVRRLVFNHLIGNADMHLKNWSLIYADKRNATLAPAYDFVSTLAYIPDDKAALKVSRSKKFSEFNQEELRHLAGRARLPETLVLETAKQTFAEFHQIWPQEKTNLELSNEVIASIDKHLKTLPTLG